MVVVHVILNKKFQNYLIRIFLCAGRVNKKAHRRHQGFDFVGCRGFFQVTTNTTGSQGRGLNRISPLPPFNITTILSSERLKAMIQKTESTSVLPFRPPKSPSSHVVANKNVHVTPKSPRRRKTKMAPGDALKKNNDQTNAMSPTSVVVDPRSLVFPEQRRSPKQENRPAGPGKAPTSNETDRSLVQAGNQCMKVRTRLVCVAT